MAALCSQTAQLQHTCNASQALGPRLYPKPGCSRQQVLHVSCSASSGDTHTRRALLQTAGIAAVLTAFPKAAEAKKKGGFNVLDDAQDGYSFQYPFGWQEVAVRGQDVVYKDVIEPLESVSVSISKTDKTDVSEFGDPEEICLTLADKVLTAPSQEVKLLNVKPKRVDNRNYLEFEFAAKSPTYVRRALAVITVGNGKFYTLVTGANERRWSKMEDRLNMIVDSFAVRDRY